MAILEKFAMRKFITLLAAIYCQPLLAIDIDDVQSQVFDSSCATSGCHNGATFPNLSSGVAFDAIVSVSSNQSSKLLIAPGNISGSYLIDKIEGTGIGLVLTKNLVEMMNGSIGFSSRLNTGSTFWVEMPPASIIQNN